MNKLIHSLAALAMAFGASVALAKTKPTTTKTTTTTVEREYTSSSSAPSFLSGGYNENEFTTLLTNGTFTSEKACKDCSTGTVIDIGASYLHYLKDGWQVGGEGRIQSLSKEASATQKSATLIDIAGVGAYNFQTDLKNSFFAKAGIGFYSVLNDARDGYDNKLGLFFGGGKRFALWNNVSYSPEARIVKKGDIDMGIEIAFLNFSVIW